MALKVTVDGLTEGGAIPVRFTCDGEDLSPGVHWSGEPAETKSFAVIVDDPDASGGTWNHWLVWDVPASVHELSQGADRAVGKPGINDFGRPGYGGPCPPSGRGPHRYFFRVFALDVPSLGLPAGTRRTILEKALRSHAIAEASFMGRYGRG